MRALDERAGDDGAVLQHVFQVHQIAVVHMLGIVIGIVEMDNARLVGRHDLPGQQDPAGNILGDLARHIVPLDGVDGGIFIGVFLLDLLVVALDEAQDSVVRGVGLAGQIPGIPIGNILLGHLKSPVGHDGLFHQVLDLLHGRAPAHFLTGNGDAFGNTTDLNRGQTDLLLYGIVGLGNGLIDLFNIKNDLCAVSFDDFHGAVLLGEFFSSLPHYTTYCGFVKTRPLNVVVALLAENNLKVYRPDVYPNFLRNVCVFPPGSKESIVIPKRI